MHHLGEVFFGQCAVLDLAPGPTEDIEGLGFKFVPAPVALEVELEFANQWLGAAIAKTCLYLAHTDGVDVLVVTGQPANVEHDSDGVDLLAQRVPGHSEDLGLGRGVA